MQPTTFELVSLYYQARAAGVTGTDAAVLLDVKKKWKQARTVLAGLSDPREYEKTPSEIVTDNDAQAAADRAEVTRADGEASDIAGYLAGIKEADARDAVRRKPHAELLAMARA